MNYQGFCDAAYTSQSILADAEDLINWYPETIESANGKTRKALYPTPGHTSFATASDSGGRALFTMNHRTLAVMGGKAGEITATGSTGTFTSYGTVATDSNLATIVMNGTIGNQAMISSGTNGYCLNLTTNVLTQVLTGKSLMVGMLDGFFISFDPSQGRMYLSDSFDGTTWDPTQFAQRSAAPDTWQAMLVNPPDIWLIGSLSGDVWYDQGTFPFPFAPRQGFNFKFGIVAPFSLAAFGRTVMWLSQTPEGSGIVVRTAGYDPQRVSTYAVERAIANMARESTIADAEALVYQEQGHQFYVLNFPTANQSWCMDIESGQWHRRGYWNSRTNQYDVWRPRVHTLAFGKHLTADRNTTTIASMSVDNGSELDGTAIRRVRRAPGVFSEHRQIPIRTLEIYMETGVGLQSGQGSDPTCMLRTSDDGGKTWSNERRAPTGRVGQYRRRVRFWRMGVPRDRINEFVVTDPIPQRVIDAYINNDVTH